MKKDISCYNDLVFHSSQHPVSWFYKKYYYNGANFRYHTLQAALNLLFQEHPDPLIVETGCQRQKEDLGAGMSTSIFGEYVCRYGGRLISVDIDEAALSVCRECTRAFAERITYIRSDSVEFLKNLKESPDLIYLDSLDYDLTGDASAARRAQEHCLNEYEAIAPRLKSDTIILLDDNDFPGGGKPKLVKERLVLSGWTCLLEWQQSLWAKKRMDIS